MRRRLHRPALVITAMLGLSCAKREPTPGPPPLPTLPAEPAPLPAATADPKPREEVLRTRPTRSAKTRAVSEPKRAEKSSHEASPTPGPRAPVSASTRASPTPPPAAVSPPPASPKPRQTRKVVVPSTAHVRAEIPSGLQADLDADPRMQAWLDRAISLIDGCHAQAGQPQGIVQATLTMHEEARPSADLGALPPMLGGVVACATGALMRIKMPLFTGREGTRYTVRMHFE